MVQKFRENVEISNKVNFRDYAKDFVILRPRIILFRPLTQHDHDRIASKREMPRVEIQPCIKEFHVYKARQLLSFLQAPVYFYGPLSFVFVNTSSVYLLVNWRLQYKKRESVYTKDRVGIRSVDTGFIFYFIIIFLNKPTETINLVWYFLAL